MIPSDYKQIILSYKSVKPKYDLLAEYLQALFKKIAERLDIHPVIQGRAKTLESFAEKIIRPGKNYTEPLKQLTDLCGVRFIVHTLDEVDRTENILEQYFNIDRSNSEDKKEKLEYHQFGYLSRHFIIQLKEAVILDSFTDAKELQELRNLKAELQVRTLAQHVWADVYHELGYKNEFQLPVRWEREFARIAAQLENCDRGFLDIKRDISSFESNFGKYMSKDQLEELAARLEILTEIENEDQSILHKLIRTYTALGLWKKIENIFYKNKEKLKSNSAVLRDAGMSICKANENNKSRYSEGQNLIKKAIELNPEDIEAHCCLSGTYKKQGFIKEAGSHYKKALNMDPSNPYALGNYIASEIIIKNDPAVIEYFTPAVKEALKRCKNQILARANIPWAYFDAGIFSLYLNDFYSSVDYYSAGVSLSQEDWIISTAAGTINEFIKAGITIKNIKHIGRFLKTAENIDNMKYDQNSFFNTDNILILAGSCEETDDKISTVLDILKKHLTNWKGVLISGGTVSGISGIAGEVQKKNSDIYTVGYLPAEDSSILDEIIDNRYMKLNHTEGEFFSIREPLAYWEDLACSVKDKRKIKLIGFGGGEISAFEYRIALAFGAKVGIIKNSGREADALLTSELWKEKTASIKSNNNKNLYALEPDDIKQFLLL
jgi:ppGpp synthetase/RelA/SpoT-type nucleotidyltranferase